MNSYVVTEEGVIVESIKVYNVAATNTADDYHKNVGEAEFTMCIKALDAILKAKGGAWVIVMDNARLAFLM